VSNPLAIAAVTSTLQKWLFDRVNNAPGGNGTVVTTRPLDRAREGQAGKQLNVFLYRTAVDAALRNADMPGGPIAPGENGSAPLPLSLHYLVTAWGEGDDDTDAHSVLGVAMQLLNDFPLLARKLLGAALQGNDLHLQAERVRLTSMPLSVDEMSRLWTTFQTQYRISAAYEASVVLIDSSREAVSAPPVARRGADDRGPEARVGPFPALERAEPASGGPSVLSGEEVALRGSALTGADAVRFRHPLLAEPVEASGAAIVSASDTEVRVAVPAQLPAGIASATVTVPQPAGAGSLPTNEVPIAVAPDIASPALPIAVARGAGDAVQVTVGVRPEALPEQRAYLIAGSTPLPAAALTTPSSTLSFAGKLAAGEYPLRLRVDGVDSPLVDRTATPAAYDPDRRLVVT
jgi:hypothetical protein